MSSCLIMKKGPCALRRYVDNSGRFSLDRHQMTSNLASRTELDKSIATGSLPLSRTSPSMISQRWMCPLAAVLFTINGEVPHQNSPDLILAWSSTPQDFNPVQKKSKLLYRIIAITDSTRYYFFSLTESRTMPRRYSQNYLVPSLKSISILIGGAGTVAEPPFGSFGSSLLFRDFDAEYP